MTDNYWHLYFLQISSVKLKDFNTFVALKGEMSEWSNEPAWKAGVLATVPRVRIPLSPQSKTLVSCNQFARVLFYRMMPGLIDNSYLSGLAKAN